MTQPAFPAYGAYGPPSHGSYGPPSQYGSIPPSQASIPPGPPPRKKSALPLVLGIAAGVIVLGGAIGGVAIWKLRTPKPGLPVDAKLLPSTTKEVGTRLIEATREPNEQVRRMYLASELGAQLCRPGAGDPAHRIESIGAYGSRGAKELFFDKKKIEEVQQLLDCGTTLSGRLASPYQSFVTFEDDTSKSRHVMVTKLDVAEIPDKLGFSRQPFGAFKGYCRTGDVPNAECRDTSPAVFASGSTWFLGDRAALEPMAASVKNPREELSSGVSALNDAVAATDGLPAVHLAGNPKSSKEFFLGPCSWAAIQSGAGMSEFLDGCFPSKAEERTLTEIDARIRGAAFELDSDYTKAGAILGNIVFVARDSDGAKRLEKDVGEVVSDWKAHAGTFDAKLIKDTKDHAVTHDQKKFGAIVDTFFRALHGMKVTRSGRTVRVSYRENLSADDVQELKDADQSTADKRLATAQILEAMQAKRPIPQAPLAKLVGPAWATYLLGPAPADTTIIPKSPLTVAECVKIQKQMQGVKLGDLPLQAHEAYFKLRYPSCGAHPPEVTGAQKACLPSVKNASDFAGCMAPPVPSNEPAEADFGDKKK